MTWGDWSWHLDMLFLRPKPSKKGAGEGAGMRGTTIEVSCRAGLDLQLGREEGGDGPGGAAGCVQVLFPLLPRPATPRESREERRGVERREDMVRLSSLDTSGPARTPRLSAVPTSMMQWRHRPNSARLGR